MCISNGS